MGIDHILLACNDSFWELKFEETLCILHQGTLVCFPLYWILAEILDHLHHGQYLAYLHSSGQMYWCSTACCSWYCAAVCCTKCYAKCCAMCCLGCSDFDLVTPMFHGLL